MTPFGDTGAMAQHAISEAILPECEPDFYGLPWVPRMTPMEHALKALVALDDAGYEVVYRGGGGDG